MLGVLRYVPSLSEKDKEQRGLTGLLLRPEHRKPSTLREEDFGPTFSGTQDIGNPRVPCEQDASVNSISWASPCKVPGDSRGP